MAEPRAATPSRLSFPWWWRAVRRRDRRRNARLVRGDRRFLVLRDPCLHPSFYGVLLRWLEDRFPEVRARFELHVWPGRVSDWGAFALHVPWLQDPVEAWSPRAFRFANRLADRCDAHGVPVVNRVDRLANAAKHEGARRIETAGLRTPRTALVSDPDLFRATRLGLPLPLFVREDWGHGGPLRRADTDAEVRSLSLRDLRRPVATELVDVRSPDGLFRKYRTVVAGDVVVRQTMHVGTDWCVRGSRTVYTDALRDEEEEFASTPAPDAVRWVAAREALGLDFVAFDHATTPSGETVVFEANPYPYLHFVGGRREHRRAPTERVLAAMTRLYLARAGLPIPPALEGMLHVASVTRREPSPRSPVT